MLVLMKMAQGIQGWNHLKDHIPTSAPISTIRTTTRSVFFTVHMHHSIAAFSGCDLNLHRIDKHSCSFVFG